MGADTVQAPDRVLPNGRGAWIYPLTFDRARLCIGQIGSPYIDDGW